jgi:hypothetical protein
MKSRRHMNLFERTIVLMLLGILMGGLGGVAVGLITGRTPNSATQQ